MKDKLEVPTLPAVTREEVDATAERLKNWGRWGGEDELGTLNFTTAQDIVHAASLVRKGRVMSLALRFDSKGPQGGKTKFAPVGRFNPIHLMLRTGTDAYSGVLDKRGIRSADDIVIMPMQCGTQWDGLGHIFYGDHMWNGYDCRLVSSFGAEKCGIEKTQEKMVGRGVLLDVPKYLDVDCLPDGFGITAALLDEVEKAQGVAVKRGDYLLIRTGQMEAKLAEGNWDYYSGGDAPGLAFDTLEWLHRKEVAAVATDTWGVEVRPNQSEQAGITQPWHWLCIPILGLTMGEIFFLGELAKDCAEDGIYEFLFVAPALPVTGAVGSPANPLVIK
ncbi:MAG TPA: cyclase family protein [Roseimicrobium sp.]|nr:cyclase family protein [Roseimicrobium sp.]